MGLEVHQAAIAVADVAQDLGAAVRSLGAIGTRPGASDHLSRTMPSHATPRIVVDAAGPGGDWLDRYLRPQGDACWVVAPSLLPPKPGARVTTDRREAVPRARVARSGALTAVEVPTVDEAASRELTRARDEARRARQDTTCRRHACVRRQASRSVGRAPPGAAPRLSSRWPCRA